MFLPMDLSPDSPGAATALPRNQQDSSRGVKVEALLPEKRSEKFLVSLTRKRKEHMMRIVSIVYVFKIKR